ncbi:MAG: hypothetical protein R3C05_27565 [Pirellulaceae bacterium]
MSLIDDDDTAGITVSPTSGLETSEGGSDRYIHRCARFANRCFPVTINFTSSDATEGLVSTDGFDFAMVDSLVIARHRNQPHTITVVGQDDNLADGNVAFTIQSQATSTDSGYQGLAGTNVAATNIDDDRTVNLQVSTSSGSEANDTDHRFGSR